MGKINFNALSSKIMHFFPLFFWISVGKINVNAFYSKILHFFRLNSAFFRRNFLAIEPSCKKAENYLQVLPAGAIGHYTPLDPPFNYTAFKVTIRDSFVEFAPTNYSHLKSHLKRTISINFWTNSFPNQLHSCYLSPVQTWANEGHIESWDGSHALSPHYFRLSRGMVNDSNSL